MTSVCVVKDQSATGAQVKKKDMQPSKRDDGLGPYPIEKAEGKRQRHSETDDDLGCIVHFGADDKTYIPHPKTVNAEQFK